MKRKIVFFIVLMITGLFFNGCKKDSSKSLESKSTVEQTESEAGADSPKTTEENKLNKKEVFDTVFVKEIDTTNFTPVKEEQYSCLPGCYVSCSSDIPFYETQNTSSLQTGTFNKGDSGYVKECGNNSNGKQWFYVVDEYTGEKGWILCDASKNNLKSNFNFLEEKNGFSLYSRRNANVAIKNNKTK